MFTFNAGDVNALINILRLLQDGIKSYRSRKGQHEPDKREQVLGETADEAEKMSAQGADTRTVVSRIQTKLEQGLGPEARDDIMRRAESMLALAEPFDMESFEYYKSLSAIVGKAKDFCLAANIFKLRGATDGITAVLPMPRLSPTLRKVTDDYTSVTDQLISGQVFRVHLQEASAFLSTSVAGLEVALRLGLENAYSTGGSYQAAANLALLLSKGSQVNRIGFDVKSHYIRGMEVRLTGKNFQDIVSAIFEDLAGYATELAEEQREFREQISPALKSILNRWPQLGKQ